MVLPASAALAQSAAPASLLSYQNLPADHYLRLTGLAGKMMRGELPATTEFTALNLNLNEKARVP